MTYDNLKQLNDSGKKLVGDNRKTFKNSEEKYYNSITVYEYLCRKQNYRIELTKKGFVIKDKIESFSLVEKDYVIGFNLSRLIDWYLNADFGVYLSNVSFLKNKLHLFNMMDISTEFLNSFFDLMYLNNFDNVFMCRMSFIDISKLALKGLELVQTWQYSVFVYKNKNCLYLVSPYKLRVCPDSYFRFSDLRIKSIYIDVFDLSQKYMLPKLFANNRSIEHVVLKDCNICSNTDLHGMFYESINLKTVQLINILENNRVGLDRKLCIFYNNFELCKVVLSRNLGSLDNLFIKHNYNKCLEILVEYV